MMDGETQYTQSRRRIVFANTLNVKSTVPSAASPLMQQRRLQTVRYRTYMRPRPAILKLPSRGRRRLRIAASHQDGTR
jgi:hypothetical protein